MLPFCITSSGSTTVTLPCALPSYWASSTPLHQHACSCYVFVRKSCSSLPKTSFQKVLVLDCCKTASCIEAWSSDLSGRNNWWCLDKNGQDLWLLCSASTWMVDYGTCCWGHVVYNLMLAFLWQSRYLVWPGSRKPPKIWNLDATDLWHIVEKLSSLYYHPKAKL